MPVRPNQIALTLSPQLRDRLRQESERTGRTVAEIIRAAITEYLDSHAQPESDDAA